MLDEEIRWAITRVLVAPERFAFLRRGGMRAAVDLARFLVRVVPLARRSIARLTALARTIPDAQLRALALGSLQSKAYHIAGAAILATFLPPGDRLHYVRIVAPLEAIYDFLDSLCDRHPETGAQAFRQLHEALADALDPQRPLHEYYLHGPSNDDGGYLRALVMAVRRSLSAVHRHEELLPSFRAAAVLYADTQTFKHLAQGDRERACVQWHADAGSAYADLTWWEFGAACGSQFHVYGPLFAAFRGRFNGLRAVYDAYFPAMAALHVLLDSFIDQAEDRAHEELNWVACYQSPDEFRVRACEFAMQSSKLFMNLASPHAHRFALRIMCLFYLTHPKLTAQHLDTQARELLAQLTTSGL